MHKPVVNSCFDIAFWLLDRALDDGEYLQPQKLHRLLYLSQAYYASAKHGAKLMPAVFVIEREGPIEPTLFKAMERGRPPLNTNPIKEDMVHVLDSVWRKFGAKSVKRLNSAIESHPPVVEALSNGLGTEISFESMVEYYVKTLSGMAQNQRKASENPDAIPSDRVLSPKLMRSQTGKPVAINHWSPRRID